MSVNKIYTSRDSCDVSRIQNGSQYQSSSFFSNKFENQISPEKNTYIVLATCRIFISTVNGRLFVQRFISSFNAFRNVPKVLYMKTVSKIFMRNFFHMEVSLVHGFLFLYLFVGPPFIHIANQTTDTVFVCRLLLRFEHLCTLCVPSVRRK